VKKASRDLVQHVAKMDTMQKIEYLHRKASELLAEMRRLERDNQKNKKRADTLQKEKDVSRSELSKTVVLKEKLEKLCRELQRDNNKLKVGLVVMKYVDPRVLTFFLQSQEKELLHLQKTDMVAYDEKYAAVLSKLEGYQEAKDNPCKQTLDMGVEELYVGFRWMHMSDADIGFRFRVRFKSFIEQYELRELHFHSLMRTKELEVQHNLARFEREKKSAEAEAAKARALQAQVLTFSKTEAELRSQLNIYVDKFKQVSAQGPANPGTDSPTDKLKTMQKVEDTLNNSNDLFLTFRKEMEDMSKKTKKLEKDNDALKRKQKATNANIITTAQEREDWRKKAEAEQAKTAKLRSIITQMQQQGRKLPAGAEPAVQNSSSEGQSGGDGGDSDYSEDEDGDEEPSESDQGDDEDDTEEDAEAQGILKEAPKAAPKAASKSTSQAASTSAPRATSKLFGPERPPASASASAPARSAPINST
jgi:hypothetical protein